MESGGADDLAARPIDSDESAVGTERFLEERAEGRLLAAIAFRVLLPDQRIGRNAEQGVEIARLQRPELQEFAVKNGLGVERH
jgi:hypothetical protein